MGITITTIVILSILIIAILIFILSSILIVKSRKKKEAIYRREKKKEKLAPSDKLPFLTLGNIFLFNESKKTLDMIAVEEAKKKLSEDWGITTQESALDKIEWMFVEGNRAKYQRSYSEMLAAIAEGYEHELKNNYDFITEELKNRLGATDIDIKNCKDLSAFDFERLGIVVRYAYNVGYLSADECYECLESLYKGVSSAYKSWREYAIAFYIGHTVCLNTVNSTLLLSYAKSYLESPDSMWNLYPLGE